MAGYTLVFQTVSQARSALLSSPEFVSSGRGDSLFLVQFKGKYTPYSQMADTREKTGA